MAEAVLPLFGDVAVIQNRTGIAMLPYRDSAQGVTFHLGEVLMAEAHVRCTLTDGRDVEGYGACLGRDTKHALAMALIDVAWRSDIARADIWYFVEAQQARLDRRDDDLRANIERTRVEMETF